MKNTKSDRPKTVEEYLSGVPEPARNTLSRLRSVIRSAAPPDAVETISYGMPAIACQGILAWYAAFENHCSFFPTASIIQKFKKELKEYSISKGTIRFSSDKPLPAALVRRMLKARVAETRSRMRTAVRTKNRSAAKRIKGNRGKSVS